MDKTQEKYKLSHYNVVHQDGDFQYMWNTYSDALLQLDKSAQQYIQQFSSLDDKSDMFKILKNNGFIVHEQLNEFGRLCVQEKQSMFNGNPDKLFFTIVPGMGCNYSCDYCFEANSDLTGVMTPEIAIDVAEYICKELRNKQDVKELIISWFGGEPLLYISIIEIISRKLMDYSQQNGIIYSPSIITNGRYLDTKNLTLLQELCIKNAQITLDGTKDIYCKSKGANTEDFDSVINNIRNACDKIKISLRLNIPNNNANEAIAITDFILKDCNLLNKVHIYFAYLCDYSLVSNDSQRAFNSFVNSFNLYIEYILKNYGKSLAKSTVSIPRRINTFCGVIRVSNACIGSRGELYKCHHDLGNNSMVIGNVWKGRFYNETELSYYMVADNPVRRKCSQCAYLPVCMGGCANNRICGCERSNCDDKKRYQLKIKLLEGGVLL